MHAAVPETRRVPSAWLRTNILDPGGFSNCPPDTTSAAFIDLLVAAARRESGAGCGHVRWSTGDGSAGGTRVTAVLVGRE